MIDKINNILTKYDLIIKEEVNVKELYITNSDGNYKKIYKPIGSRLSNIFGKDTGMIIKNGKLGNIEMLENNRLRVFDDLGQEWFLESEDYEIAYEGFDDTSMAIDQNIIVKLDLELTDDLRQEGFIREISRFLNQMRKNANYLVDDKVDLFYFIESEEIKSLIIKNSSFLIQEALLKDLIFGKNKDVDIESPFEVDGIKIIFGLKK